MYRYFHKITAQTILKIVSCWVFKKLVSYVKIGILLFSEFPDFLRKTAYLPTNIAYGKIKEILVKRKEAVSQFAST